MIAIALAVAFSLPLAGPACAELLSVGPGQAFARPADALAVARDGDTVRIAAGTYRGRDALALITARRLLIEADGDAVVTMQADGAATEGKALWVLRMPPSDAGPPGLVTVRGIVFSGTRVPDDNGAGIRLERGHLRVEGCRFVDNQMGLLTGNDPDSTLAVHRSHFADAPREPGRLHHLLYVGRIARFTLTRSTLQGGYIGHLVKSRAQASVLRDNRIDDGPAGQASYLVDLPNGGDALLEGNRLGQGPRPENRVMVAFGAEGEAWPVSRLRLQGNRLAAVRPGAVPLRVWRERLPAGSLVETRDNTREGTGWADAEPVR